MSSIPIWGGPTLQEFCEGLAAEKLDDCYALARLKEHAQLRETQLLTTIEMANKAAKERDEACNEVQRLRPSTRLRQTHTFVVLDITPDAFKEIREKLLAAGYLHAMTNDGERELVDMHGIAVAAERKQDIV